MDKVKHSGQNLSLRKSLTLYVMTLCLLAFVLYGTTAFLCDRIITAIRASYPISGEKYYLTNEQGEQFGDGTYISGTSVSVLLTKRDAFTIDILEFIPVIAAPIYSVLCIITAVLLFYRNKLKRPLDELRKASEKIADNNLDFSIKYDSKDELGQLCTSFETMRAMLAKNFSEMWRQVEERKQLNAAFAHDLRTPLTVLKGYNEMIQASNDVRTRQTAATMGRHISRMEAYINSMSSLQRLEDAQPEYKTVSLQPFLSSLYESAEIVCAQNGKILCRQNQISASQLSIDTEFVSQVYNNLISNAVRYAATTVTLTFELHDNGLQLSVSDDGKGFDKDILQKATSPYFTEETDHSEHFGIGLYICKLLCEHHGGFMKIENISSGARVTAFFQAKS